MKRLAIAFSVAVAGVAMGGDRNEAAARRAAGELAGAWANDGFKLRDGHWTGSLLPGKPQIVQVNLFAGNRYWFTAAGSGPISLGLFNESGQPVPTETFQDGSRSAAGFAPASSGLYFVKLEQTGSHPSTFCLVYSYK